MPSSLFHQAWTVTKVFFARLRFVAVFVIAALVIGYWDNIKNHVDKWTRPPQAPDALAHTHAGETEFYCPMHPRIVREEQGQCPICGMPLVKRKKGEGVQLPADVLARVQLTPQRVELANVHVFTVEYRLLTRDVQALGVVNYDETKLARLSARVPGRVDKLFVTFTGQAVKQGDPLYSLYSPDVYRGLEEYLTARKQAKATDAATSADARADAQSLTEATRQKLLLWQIDAAQLDQIAAEYDRTGIVPTHITVNAPMGGIVVAKNVFEGGYVQTGDNVFTVADLATLWLQARLFERDAPLIHVGDRAEVSVSALPQKPFAGVVSYTAFQLDPETRTLDARIEVKNADLELRPGMFATATIRVPIGGDAQFAETPTTQPQSMTAMPAMPVAPPTTVPPDTQPAPPAPTTPSRSTAVIYRDALESYLKAQQLLAGDQADGVPALLEATLEKLRPISDGDLADDYQRLADATAKAKGQSIDQVRETSFKQFSSGMIAIGKSIGLPRDAGAVQVAFCPMVKSTWLQAEGPIVNPYMGSKMLTCGNVLSVLPRAPEPATPTPAPMVLPVATQPTHPSIAPEAPAASHARRSANVHKVLAVPRSAVIDTGERKIVYVQSSYGVYDMRAIKIGPAAGDFYPVLDGLSEGEKVVTIGAFLIDAENRLNPTQTIGTPAAPTTMP